MLLDFAEGQVEHRSGEFGGCIEVPEYVDDGATDGEETCDGRGCWKTVHGGGDGGGVVVIVVAMVFVVVVVVLSFLPF